MGNALTEMQLAQGAIFDPEYASTVPATFGNDEAAYQAIATGVALCDRSHWGRLRVFGADRLRFLHNQTTNQIQQLQPGQGCETVFVTSTGRTLDLVTAYLQDDAVLLLVSPGQAPVLSQWMDRYIFFADKVTIADETATTITFTLLGPQSAALLTQLGVAVDASAAEASHYPMPLAGAEGLLAVGSGLGLPGFTLIANATAGATLWQTLVDAGAVPAGDRVWQQLRVEQGRPLPGAELTADYNPLEAALWKTVAFDKGCYIGQETIARLNTYQGVKQQLWGLHLEASADPGTPITLNGDKVGVLTSCIDTPAGVRGLGYIRTKAGGAGLTVAIAGTSATVVDLPFATRGYLATSHP